MSVYVGMDVHRKRSQVAIVDQAGAVQRNRNLPNDPCRAPADPWWAASRYPSGLRARSHFRMRLQHGR